jgi:hypothetical protein
MKWPAALKFAGRIAALGEGGGACTRHIRTARNWIRCLATCQRFGRSRNSRRTSAMAMVRSYLPQGHAMLRSKPLRARSSRERIGPAMGALAP